MTKNFLLSLLALCISGVTLAQKNELGVFVGSSGYFGDIGHDRAESTFLHQSPAIGLVHKINFHDYLSFRTSVQIGTIKAEDSWSKYADRRARDLSFKSQIIDVNLGFEFNFSKYTIRKRKTIKSPYLFAGISLLSFNPQAQNSLGQWVDLQPLGTEGQGTTASPNGKYQLTTWAIPFGLGYKANFGKKLAVSVEWTWRAAKTDYLDDVSSYYIDGSLLSDASAEMANPSNIDITPGKTRGNPNNNDWYNFAGFTLSYKIKNRPKKCPKALLP